VGLISESAEKMLRGSGTQESLHKIVLGFMREGFCYSKTCARGGLDDDEIFSLTFKALSAAARKFDPKKGRFFIFAKIYLRWEMKHARQEKSLVRHGETPDIHLPEVEDVRAGSGDGRDQSNSGTDWDTNPEENDNKLTELPADAVVMFDYDKIEFDERMDMLIPHIKELNENERMVLNLRYSTGWDFARIGKKIDRSRERVRQIALEAIEKLRQKVRA
jgi:RNA polymerase sigma factor (sigma-70 family)